MNRSPRCLCIILPALSLLLLLVGCSRYRHPENSESASIISGDFFGESRSGKTQIELQPYAIDGQGVDSPIGFISSEKRAIHQYTIEPGRHEFWFYLIRNIPNSSSYDRDYRSIEVTLLAGRVYRLTGELIAGNAIKYWVEDIHSGEVVSRIYYDPVGLEKELQAIDSTRKSDPKFRSRIEVSAKGMFVLKEILHPGQDCISLVENRAINESEYALSIMFSMAPGNSPGSLKYGYRSYEDICFDVKAGHVYELKGSRLDPETKQIRKGKERWVELWDITDDKLLKKYGKWELKIKISEFE